MNTQISSLLHWYLKTESESASTKEAKASKEGEKNIKLFQSFFTRFQVYIQENNAEAFSMISKQLKIFDIFKAIAKSVK